MMSRSVPPFERFGEFVPVADAELTPHVFVAGETLSGLAHRYYGDWREWRIIAERNTILDPRQITPGATLLIPKKQLEVGRYESF